MNFDQVLPKFDLKSLYDVLFAMWETLEEASMMMLMYRPEKKIWVEVGIIRNVRSRISQACQCCQSLSAVGSDERKSFSGKLFHFSLYVFLNN